MLISGKRIRIYPYKMGSKSARMIQGALAGLGYNVKRVRRIGRYRYRTGDVVINWGSSHIPPWMNSRAVLNTSNRPHIIHNTVNKIECFRALFSAEIPTVEFTTDRHIAQGWNSRVYVRHKVCGHGGDGIQVCEAGEVLPNARLYTRGVNNSGEYRVHVFNGSVIDYRKKSRRVGDPSDDSTSLIRNVSNGWIFRKSNLRRLERIENLAVSAVDALGLDFGAVDIIKDENGDVMVLEVNSACGMDDLTLSNYVDAIVRHSTNI